MGNKNTKLVYRVEDNRLYGIGFSTVVDGVEYRGAVKVPENLDNEKLYKIWHMLRCMLANPKHKACRCVSGDEMLLDKELTIDDYDCFEIFYHLEFDTGFKEGK